MKIENQCCSREQGEQLLKLGITEKSFLAFCWVSTSHEDSVIAILPTNIMNIGIPDEATTFIAPAFTVAELGVMLEMDGDKHLFDYFYNNHAGCFEVVLNERDERAVAGIKLVNREEGDTEAEARAAMLIWLLENNIATAEEVNARLNEQL